MTFRLNLLKNRPNDRPWPEQLFRLLIILGILVASALLIPNASTPLIMLLILGIPAIGAVLFLLRQPQWGLVLLVPVSMVVPVQLGTGTGSGLNAPMLMVGGLTALWVMDMLILRHDVRLHRSRPLLPLFGLIVTVGLAFVAGQLPWFSIPGAPLTSQIGAVGVFVLSAAAFLLAAHQVDDVKWLRWMVWIFLAMGAPYMVGRMIPRAYGVSLQHLYPVGATSSLFWTWVAALTGGQLLFNRELKGRWQVALIILLAASIYVTLSFFEWKSGWLPPLATLGALLWMKASRLRVWLLLMVAVATAFYFGDSAKSLITGEEYSWTTRVEAWRIVLQLAMRDPIFGLGPANYYFYTPLISILGWNVQFNSHNQYVDLIAQVGFVGLAFYLWFFWEMVRLALQLRTRVPEGFAQAYVYGVFGGIVGMLIAGMLGDWVLPYVYNVGLVGFRASGLGWMFMGGLVALQRIEQDDSEKKKNDQGRKPEQPHGKMALNRA